MDDKLGYYSIGSNKFSSKVEACILAEKILQKLGQNINPFSILKWTFNDDIFKSYNWMEEPEESLDYLYDKRAKDLREKYDYIIVSYSGGSDSHNVLMSFLRQNLFVDEIIVTHMNKAMNDYAVIDFTEKSAKYAYSSEYVLQTIPRLNEITNLTPKSKIRIFDVSDSVFDAFSKQKDESWIFNVREELNPVDASRYNYLQFSDFKKQLDFNKKTAIVLGVDKPKIEIDTLTNNAYICFDDRIANVSPIGEYTKDYTNTNIEYFYWSPDACSLLCKQAHTILKFLNNNKKFIPFFSGKSVSRNFSERTLRPLLYSTWNSNWFQADKAYFDWHSTFDSWFIQKHKNSLEYLLWKKGLLYVIKNCPSFIYKNDVPDSFIRFNKKYRVQ